MIPRPYRYLQTYFGLTVEPSLFANFPDALEWQGNKFLKKDEFHVTICKGESIFNEVVKLGIGHNEAEHKLLTFIEIFIRRTPIKLLSFINDFRYVQDDLRSRMGL